MLCGGGRTPAKSDEILRFFRDSRPHPLICWCCGLHSSPNKKWTRPKLRKNSWKTLNETKESGRLRQVFDGIVVGGVEKLVVVVVVVLVSE